MPAFCDSFSSSPPPLPTKERGINFPLNNFQFPRLLFSSSFYRLRRLCHHEAMIRIAQISRHANINEFSSGLARKCHRVKRKKKFSRKRIARIFCALNCVNYCLQMMLVKSSRGTQLWNLDNSSYVQLESFFSL